MASCVTVFLATQRNLLSTAHSLLSYTKQRGSRFPLTTTNQRRMSIIYCKESAIYPQTAAGVALRFETAQSRFDTRRIIFPSWFVSSLASPFVSLSAARASRCTLFMCLR